MNTLLYTKERIPRGLLKHTCCDRVANLHLVRGQWLFRRRGGVCGGLILARCVSGLNRKRVQPHSFVRAVSGRALQGSVAHAPRKCDPSVVLGTPVLCVIHGVSIPDVLGRASGV